MSSNPYLAYVESKVISASPLELIALAYEGAIEAIEQARAHLAAKQISERCQKITKAQLIICELQKALDYERGGEIARNLGGLYGYIQDCLREGNFQQNDELFAEAQQLLETVATSWKQLSAKETAAPFSLPVPAQTEYPVNRAAFSYSL